MAAEMLRSYDDDAHHSTPARHLHLLEPKHQAPDQLTAQAARWLDFLAAAGRAADATVRSYQCDLRQFVEHLRAQGRTLALGDVTPTDIVRFRDSNPRWKPATVRRKLAALSSWFDWLVEHGDLEANPATAVSGPDLRAQQTSYVTADDAVAMLLACRNDRERAIFMTFWRAGLRYGELRDLRLDDLDLSRNELRVRGKGGHVAAVPVLSDLRPYLVRWLEARPEVAHDYLFTSRTGAPMYDTCARRLFTRLIRHAGLAGKRYTPHSLRHGCATALYEAGVDIGTVARFLRHRDLTTVNRYVHASTGRIRYEIENRLGSHDGDALSTLNAAQMEALIDRIADRVATKLVSQTERPTE
ncbi:MAG: tyrosine-type recombinase/integrase [Armatimonadota bacterium]